jgi:hypothetical protein
MLRNLIDRVAFKLGYIRNDAHNLSLDGKCWLVRNGEREEVKSFKLTFGWIDEPGYMPFMNEWYTTYKPKREITVTVEE